MKTKSISGSKSWVTVKVAMLLVLCTMGLSISASAQLEEYYKVQEDDEIVQMRENKVAGISVLELAKEGKMLVFNRLYSAEGRLLAEIGFYERKYFTYDEQGRLVARVDSFIREDGSMEILRSAMEYDKEGKLLAYKNENVDLKMTYKKGLGKGTVKSGDTTYTVEIKYDKKGRWTEFNQRMIDGPLATLRTMNYDDKKERPLRETKVFYAVDYKDSIMLFYFYNDAGKMKVQTQLQLKSLLVRDEDGGVPTSKAENVINLETDYTYDDKNRLIASEKFNLVHKKLPEYRTYSYDDKGLVKAFTIQTGKLSPRMFEHQYYYWP